MAGRLRRLLSKPTFDDEEMTRVAGVLHMVLLCSIAVIFAASVLLYSTPHDLPALLVLPSLILLSFVCLLLVHGGKLRLAGGLFLGILWLTTTFGSLTYGGVRSPSIGGFMLIVIIATLLFKQRWMLFFIALNTATIAVFFALETYGVELPRLTPDTPGIAFASHLIHFCTAGIFLSMAVKGLQVALRRARDGEARAEQILRDAQGARKYADNILASMAESLIILDASGTIVTVNRATLKLLGARERDLLGHPFADILLDPSHDEGITSALAPSLVERTYKSPEGREIPVLFARSELRDDLGKPLGAVCVASDITHIKQAEAGLREAKELAEEANLAKSRFLANMSHELRTPLNAVIGYAEMLMEEEHERGLSSSLDELRKIQFAGKHLLGLISDILDLSKIEAGRMDVHLETFDVADMVEAVLGTIRPIVAKSGNQLVVTCPSDLGFVHADLTKIRQILLNLFSNAAKFTQKGTVKLLVSRELRGTIPMLQFIVADTGIGMTQKQQSQLFQAFSQGDSATARRFGGTGLGLAISKAFCDMLGGTIEVASQLGVGTAFTVRLPFMNPRDLSGSKRAVSLDIIEAARAAAQRSGVGDHSNNLSNNLSSKTSPDPRRR